MSSNLGLKSQMRKLEQVTKKFEREAKKAERQI